MTRGETPDGYLHPRHPKIASPMTRIEQYGHLLRFQRRQGLSTDTTLGLPSSSEDGKSNDTRRHLKVIRTLVIQR